MLRPVMFAVAVVAIAIAVVPSTASAQKWYEKAVKGVSAKFTPAEAKPGETVTFTITVDLADTFYTYPTAQPEQAAKDFVNSIKFPAPAGVIFVGSVTDPAKLPSHPEPDLMVKELRYCPGVTTYTRKAVVSPKAAAGPLAVKATLKMNVCGGEGEKKVCYPSKAVDVEAALKILDGPPVAVAKEYQDEVTKALDGK